MSLIEQFPQIGAGTGGGGGGSWNGGTVTGATTFEANLTAAASLLVGPQTVTLNGGAQNVSLTNAALVVTGSATGSTVNLPSAAANAYTFLLLINEATVAWTLGSAAGNIDGAATQTIVAGALERILWSDGTNWRSAAPGQSFNDGRYPQVAAANTFSADNTFSGEVDLNGVVTLGPSTIALNGGTQTIGTTSALVRVTGSTASSTVAMPASPKTNQLMVVDSQATVTYTLSGNGSNIDGAASKTVAAAGGFILWYTGSQWESLATSPWLNLTVTGNWTFNGTVTLTESIKLVGLIIAAQAASTSSVSVSDSGTSAAYVESTYSPTGAQTLTLPTSGLTTGQSFWVVDEGLDAATNNITVSGNGKNINGASTITLAKNGAAVGMRYNGTNWFIFSAYNYP